MLWHCGLLSERPERDATLQWVRRGGWDLPGHPPSIEHERRVWLAMPGFSLGYHVHTLGASREVVTRHAMRDYEQLKADVAKNWLSATREDCVRLARLRPGTGNLPLLCQLRIADDLKRGMREADIVRDYGVHRSTVSSIRKGVFRNTGRLPSGFELLVPSFASAAEVVRY